MDGFAAFCIQIKNARCQMPKNNRFKHVIKITRRKSNFQTFQSRNNRVEIAETIHSCHQETTLQAH